MKRNVATWATLLLCCTFLQAQISKFIHVDQFGYTPDATKVAVLCDPQIGYNSGDAYSAPANMELRDANDDSVVFSAAPTQWNSGSTHAQSGDRGWWFDFSSYTNSGTFYVYDALNDERSPEFEIKNDVYKEVLKAAVKMYYYNRCNMEKVQPYAEANWTDGNNFENALQDANCRFYNDASNAALEKDLTGGWFDAGDYNKYTTFATSAVHQLLAAYEDNPDIFTDDWNIPESGNGIPDLLDEVKWELDWLLKMTNDDGSAIIKMGSISYNDNADAPPSANTDQRYYGETCTSASIAVAGMFARAAMIFDDFPGMDDFVTDLETEAIAAWDYVLPALNSNNLDFECDDGTIKAGDADRTEEEQREEALVAAIYLFAQLGDAEYDDYVVANLNDATPITDTYWDAYQMPLQDALMHYTTLPSANTATKNTIINSITTTVNNNWNGFYGFNEDDLYRAFMPDWAYHWGSSSPKAAFANLNLLLNRYDINPGNADDYRLKAKEQLHYFHGVNPQGMVQLSNMYDFGGDRCVNEIYHTWFNDGTDWDNAETSLYGPAPGFITGGSNSNYDSNTGLQPPYNQPDQKSYLDWNSSGIDESWEITEPAIYYQANYVRLLANFVSAEAPLAVDWLDPLWGYHDKGSNFLFWTTSLEVDNAYFEIQRSADGLDWENIGRVNGNGNTLDTSRYTFKDIQPLEAINYYRLRQVDTDGRFEYSTIISIRNQALSTLTIAPNPAKDLLLVQSDIDRGYLEILSIDGTRLLMQYINRSSIELNISSLPKGIYFIKVTDQSNQQQMEKLVKY